MEIHHPGSISKGPTWAKNKGGAWANPSVKPWQEAETSFFCYFENTRSLVKAL